MFDPQKRSEIMSRIRSKNTKGEIIVRKYLHRLGFRFRLHDSKLPGKPDIVLPKYKSVIFVHGCFWHGHQGCKYYRVPKTNPEYWIPKIRRNVERDNESVCALSAMGWGVEIIWECELKKDSEKRLDELAHSIVFIN
ncbi:very short patch repair endonuclease [Cohnella zeiphila]|uniref:Very short patch repair endonuclease n=1 Tax=Cohnella zeiphila TaxID=2761120 RepID=A0A7X0VZJ3_9BACL|nr:very short patch repair endonuclease [Cohnella zeiphila]MBB6734048.1 DNA mismatch endonuclease Vsr [Cohnella zeiphila]